MQVSLLKALVDACVRANNAQNACRMHYVDRLKLALDWAKYPNLKVSTTAAWILGAETGTTPGLPGALLVIEPRATGRSKTDQALHRLRLRSRS